MFSADLGVTPSSANYIEDVFSTYLYTGNGSTQTITNGIDLSGKGGLVWTKVRSTTYSHFLADTLRGAGSLLSTNNTSGADTGGNLYSGFNSDGYGVTTSYGAGTNGNGATYASWTFRKQAKFFDVVTFTAPASGTIVVPHNLGSTPGCVITKATGISQFWVVNHRSLSSTEYLVLNDTAAKASAGALTYTADANNVTFSAGYLSASTAYVMYLFAHDAGGFGATGTDNVISCGTFTTNGSGNATVTLGYEPQFVITKSTSATGDWNIEDVMRGMSNTSYALLKANLNNAEAVSTTTTISTPTATGFTTTNQASNTAYIYIAIRRGPMKTPTVGTSVFYPGTTTNDTSTMTTGFPVDMMIEGLRNATFGKMAFDRLRGNGQYLYTNATDAEAYSGNSVQFQNNTGINGGAVIGAGYNYIFWNFRRAPGFFDVVCYSGNGLAQTVSHNLGAAPELMIVKRRATSAILTGWIVYVGSLGSDKFITLNTTNAVSGSSSIWNNTAPTSTTFTVNATAATGDSGGTYVAYLFATVAGVSKVGSYTGTGTTKQIDCGFTGGARFVLIKRTDSTGDWYVWDSARGIVAGNDPYLLLNSTAAEVTNTDYVDTYSAGFEISSTAPAAINANGGAFIFLAIA